MVMVQYGEKEGYMDGFLKDNLDLYKKMVKNSRDLVFIVTGREREGKSVHMNQILKYFDPTYNLDRCCFNGEDFIKKIREAKQFEAIGYDEAQEFTSRSSISKFNKMMVQALSLIGVKQLFLGICIPSFFELDKYPAIHRSNFLIRVYSDKGHRGRFEFYNWEQKKKLYLFGKKGYDYSVAKKNFMGMFTLKAFPFDKDAYNKKKLEAMEEGLEKSKDLTTKQLKQRNHLIKYLYEVDGLTGKEISEIIRESKHSLTKTQVYAILSEYKQKEGDSLGN